MTEAKVKGKLYNMVVGAGMMHSFEMVAHTKRLEGGSDHDRQD